MWPGLGTSLPPQPIIPRYRCHGVKWESFYRSNVVLRAHLKLLFWERFGSALYLFFFFFLPFFLSFSFPIPSRYILPFFSLGEKGAGWEIGGSIRSYLNTESGLLRDMFSTGIRFTSRPYFLYPPQASITASMICAYNSFVITRMYSSILVCTGIALYGPWHGKRVHLTWVKLQRETLLLSGRLERSSGEPYLDRSACRCDMGAHKWFFEVLVRLSALIVLYSALSIAQLHYSISLSCVRPMLLAVVLSGEVETKLNSSLPRSTCLGGGNRNLHFPEDEQYCIRGPGKRDGGGERRCTTTTLITTTTGLSRYDSPRT